MKNIRISDDQKIRMQDIRKTEHQEKQPDVLIT